MSRAQIVINGRADRERAVEWIGKAPAGTRVEFKAPKRSLPQNDRFHAMLTDVSVQHTINGRKYTVQDWKIMFLTAYAEETGLEIRYLPALHRAGMVPSGRSSSDLSVKEMSEVMSWMEAWSTEQNPPVVWSDPTIRELEEQGT